MYLYLLARGKEREIDKDDDDEEGVLEVHEGKSVGLVLERFRRATGKQNAIIYRRQNAHDIRRTSTRPSMSHPGQV